MLVGKIDTLLLEPNRKNAQKLIDYCDTFPNRQYDNFVNMDQIEEVKDFLIRLDPGETDDAFVAHALVVSLYTVYKYQSNAFARSTLDYLMKHSKNEIIRNLVLGVLYE